MSNTGAHSQPIYTGVIATNSPDYIEAVFACYDAGHTVVPLTGNSIELPRQIKLQDVITPSSTSGWLQRPLPENAPEAIAQITFTSGTEGKPKGVAIPHRSLMDTVERLNAIMRVDETIREYIGVPVYYSFGFGRCRAACKAGGRAYIPKDGFSLVEFAAFLRDGSVNALSAVPTLLRLVLRNPELFQDCRNNLRWIEIGSQYMASTEKAALCALFPKARIVMHYGMTEASRTTLQVISETPDDALDSVGQTYGSTEVRIGDDGRIQIRGPHVASYYLVDEEEHSLTDLEGWFRSNDIGEIRDGQLWFKGRADDIINVSGVKVAAEMIEQKLHAQISDPERVAVTSITDPLRGEKVFVAVERAADIDLIDLERVAGAVLAGVHPAFKGALTVERVSDIPRTATNKVRRNALRRQVAEATKTAAPAVSSALDTDKRRSQMDRVIAAFQHQFPRAEIAPESTLETLGGTSLDYVELTLELERILDHDPGDWHSSTLRDLCTDEGSGRWQLRFDQMAARAACAVLVVLAHVIGDTPMGGLKLAQEHSLRLFNDFANYFKMPLFAFVSGWSFALLNTASMRPKDFAVSTIKTLVIPTVLTMVAFAALISQIGRSTGAAAPGLEQIFLNPYEHFWFIQTLVLLVFATYVGMRLPGHGSTYFLVSLVVLPIATPSLFATPFLSINGILILGPFFALGILLSAYIDRTVAYPLLTIVGVGSLSLLAIVGAALIYRDTGSVLLMPHLAGFLVGLPLVFLCLLCSAYLPWIKRIAPYTFYIYLWHVFATSATRRALYAFGIEDIAINVVAGVAAGLACPIIACLILKRLNLFAIFTGRW